MTLNEKLFFHQICSPNSSLAALVRASRWLGSAMLIRALALSLSVLPKRLTYPCSVTIQSTCSREVVTAAPFFTNGTILDSPFCVNDGKARMAFPPSENLAPSWKSSCPPIPEKTLVPIVEATICPVKSIYNMSSQLGKLHKCSLTSIKLLMAVTLEFLPMTVGLLT
jgi:hypothetical protein